LVGDKEMDIESFQRLEKITFGKDFELTTE
jgi:hypothetical protein